jgi:hypothetical protein
VHQLLDPFSPAELGNKALNLRHAATAGIPVPPSLIITRTDMRLAHNSVRVATWMKHNPSSLYVARSSHPDEDSSSVSHAGEGQTIHDLPPRPDELWAEALSLLQSDTGTLSVILQPQIRCLIGGVTFAFSEMNVTEANYLSTILTTSGSPPDITIIQKHRRFDIAAHSPPPAEIAPIDLALRLDAFIRSTAVVFGRGIDIEWAQVTNCLIVLLQVRPITRAVTQ